VEHFDRNWRALQLENLVDLSLWTGDLHSPEELIEELLRRAMGTLDASMGYAALITEENREKLSRSLDLGKPLPSLQDLFSLPADELFSSGKAVRRTRSDASPFEVLAAPLLWRASLLGYIILGDKESREGMLGFSDSDTRYLMALTRVIANALSTSFHLQAMEEEKLRLEEENRSLRELGRSEGFIGSSPPILRMLEIIARVAPTDVSVMFRGESGSGKERVAHLLHASSSRSDGPFIALNCAALPESLLEAELFGIEEGVATGVQRRRGRLELAHGGSLFLDEVGDLSLPLQAKLLRLVQEREFERLGGRENIIFDARLITATNRDLEEMIEKGLFRRDLYYRLRVVVIKVPSLRERPTDIPLLTRHFLEKFSGEFQRADLRISRAALHALCRAPFPGNVRELENRIQAAVAMAGDHEEIDLAQLGMDEFFPGELRPGDAYSLADIEREHILRVLELTGGKKSEASRILGINRSTLYRKMMQFAINGA